MSLIEVTFILPNNFYCSKNGKNLKGAYFVFLEGLPFGPLDQPPPNPVPGPVVLLAKIIDNIGGLRRWIPSLEDKSLRNKVFCNILRLFFEAFLF